jgi:hypothetical protein
VRAAVLKVLVEFCRIFFMALIHLSPFISSLRISSQETAG